MSSETNIQNKTLTSHTSQVSFLGAIDARLNYLQNCHGGVARGNPERLSLAWIASLRSQRRDVNIDGTNPAIHIPVKQF